MVFSSYEINYFYTQVVPSATKRLYKCLTKTNNNWKRAILAVYSMSIDFLLNEIVTRNRYYSKRVVHFVETCNAPLNRRWPTEKLSNGCS